MEWYYVENGQQAGPVDETNLGDLVREGRVNAQTLVWNATMSNWQPYAEVAAQMTAGGVATALPEASAAAAPASAYCAECGRVFAVEEMVQYGSSYVCAECKPVFFQKIKEGVNVPGQFVYAGFWIRFGAKIIDGLLMQAVLIPIRMLIGAGGSVRFGMGGLSDVTAGGILLAAFLIQITLQIAYYVYMHGKYGQTLGKMACGIRVVQPGGEQISYLQAFGRFFAEILSGIILYIGYIMAGFDDQKRALHDRICDTRVVYKR